MGESTWSWSKTAASNASADSSINWAEGQSPGTVNNSGRSMMAAEAKLRDDQGGALTLAGGTTAYTLTTNQGLAALADGVRVHAVVNSTNTGASTLAVDGLTAKAIRKITTAGELALVAGDLVANQHAVFQYDASANSAAGGWILLNPAPKPPTMQKFTASGTWTKPTGCVAVEVWVVGPGGGGGGATGGASNASVGAGGGAGEFAREFITSGLGTTETVTVGTGGAGGTAAATPNSGSNGSGASSFGSHVSAGAGSGGGRITSGTSAVGQIGGAGGNGGSGGDWQVAGAPGGLAIRFSGTSAIGGEGGNGPFGGGARNTSSSDSNGDNADANSGGGGAGAVSLTTAQQAGGNGADGIVIVWEFY